MQAKNVINTKLVLITIMMKLIDVTPNLTGVKQLAKPLIVKINAQTTLEIAITKLALPSTLTEIILSK